MSLDVFAFTPPDPELLGHAIERAQAAARRRFLQIYMGDDRPTSAEFAALVRSLRDLTAMHRTLRKMAGPLFDPASPLRPAQRLALFERRLERTRAALGIQEGEPRPIVLPPGTPNPGPDLFVPPLIEDLVGAVELATALATDRFDNLDRKDRPGSTTTNSSSKSRPCATSPPSPAPCTAWPPSPCPKTSPSKTSSARTPRRNRRPLPRLRPTRPLFVVHPSTQSDASAPCIPPAKPDALNDNIERLPQTAASPMIPPVPCVQPFQHPRLRAPSPTPHPRKKILHRPRHRRSTTSTISTTNPPTATGPPPTPPVTSPSRNASTWSAAPTVMPNPIPNPFQSPNPLQTQT
jgi:hypothetical protein